MIEKLYEIDIENFPMGDAGAQFLTILAHINGAKRKINELADAVNKLETPAENVQTDAESRPVNVQDKFAEQRKWIGKLCKFWDIDNDNLYYGPLTKIHDISPYCYECNHKVCYANCEPVKDDIIYKGE